MSLSKTIIQNKTKFNNLKNDCNLEMEKNEDLMLQKKILESEIIEMETRKKESEAALNIEVIEDLHNKNLLLQEELNKIVNLFQLYYDTNYLYQRLTSMDPYSLTSFLKLLNTQIIENNNRT
jgi:hypothetical protein